MMERGEREGDKIGWGAKTDCRDKGGVRDIGLGLELGFDSDSTQNPEGLSPPARPTLR